MSFLRSDVAATIFFAACFCADTTCICGRHLFLWKVCRHQRRLDKVRTSETVTIARRCPQYAQPRSPAVSHGNDWYNTNSPSASVVTILRNCSHTHVRVPAYTGHGYYSRVVFISLRASDCAATIRGRRLFKELQYVLNH